MCEMWKKKEKARGIRVEVSTGAENVGVVFVKDTVGMI